MSDKVLIVGESNPFGGGDEFALYPAPDGCSGHRLCCLILGMRQDDYLEAFDRCNLVQGKWSIVAARKKAESLRNRRVILCGSRVCAAFGVPFQPLLPLMAAEYLDTLILPHPSGRNLIWNQDGIMEDVRTLVSSFAPEVAHLIGRTVPS